MTEAPGTRDHSAAGFLTLDNSHLSRPTGPITTPRLTVRDYLRAATPESTRRAYAGDLRHFLRWGGVVPASEEMVAQYLADHAGMLAVSTLLRRLATLSRAHEALGAANPTRSELVRATLKGIRRVHGAPPRQVAALTREDIAAMVAGLGEGLKDRRDRALLLVGFAGAFRRSEMVAHVCTDVERVPQGMVLTVRRGKTDQLGAGRRVAIPYGRGELCPVQALDAWLAAAGITEGPVFRRVNRHGQVSSSALSPEAVSLVVKARAKAAGFDPMRYAGHSLRAGFVTSAAAAGVPSWRIREQTGHRSEAMLQHYIRQGEMFVEGAALALL